MKFEILIKDRQSNARAGTISLPHGKVETPSFVPVGTQASVKALSSQELKEIGVKIFFGTPIICFYALALKSSKNWEVFINSWVGMGRS